MQNFGKHFVQEDRRFQGSPLVTGNAGDSLPHSLSTGSREGQMFLLQLMGIMREQRILDPSCYRKDPQTVCVEKL